ncbi:hypothetical protein [Rhizobium terrae]|uniref:hypothetical protein n=1 Tax=Rhizobium terrae TaxID=2171756 RepID=UPI000E3E4D67|nr:hypothetical protein [Rhizobium terrae]
MIANHMKPVLAAAALVSALAAAFPPAAEAGDRRRDWGDRGHGYHRVENSRWDRQGDGRRNRPAEIDRQVASDRSISHIRRLGNFYGGSIEAYGVRGLGTFFLRDVWPASVTDKAVLAPKAKIIDVEQAMGGNVFASQSCAFEAGVCIIRGGN